MTQEAPTGAIAKFDIGVYDLQLLVGSLSLGTISSHHITVLRLVRENILEHYVKQEVKNKLK